MRTSNIQRVRDENVKLREILLDCEKAVGCMDPSKTLVENISELKSENARLKTELAEARDSTRFVLEECNVERRRLKAENARLAECLAEWEEKEGGCCPENVSFVDVIANLRADNARLATTVKEAQAALGEHLAGFDGDQIVYACQEYAKAEDALDVNRFDTEDYCLSGAVRDLSKDAATLNTLLAPTIGLLEECRKQPVVCAGHRIDNELARLRAACGEGKEK